MTAETVACKWCSTSTQMLGTKMCDRCWELESRIKGDQKLAAQILAEELEADARCDDQGADTDYLLGLANHLRDYITRS